MHRTLIGLILFAAAPNILLAQRGRCLGVPDSVFSADMRPELARLAQRVGLAAALDPSDRPDSFELRFWDGLNPTVASALVIREADGVWRGYMARRAEDGAGPARLRELSGDWAARWRVIQSMGLEELPSCGGQSWQPVLPQGAFLELRRGPVYRSWSYFRDMSRVSEWKGALVPDSLMLAIVRQLRAWSK